MYQISPKTGIPKKLKDTKEIHMRHLFITVYEMKRTDEDKHFIWPLFGSYYDLNNSFCNQVL